MTNSKLSSIDRDFNQDTEPLELAIQTVQSADFTSTPMNDSTMMVVSPVLASAKSLAGRMSMDTGIVHAIRGIRVVPNILTNQEDTDGEGRIISVVSRELLPNPVAAGSPEVLSDTGETRRGFIVYRTEHGIQAESSNPFAWNSKLSPIYTNTDTEWFPCPIYMVRPYYVGFVANLISGGGAASEYGLSVVFYIYYNVLRLKGEAYLRMLDRYTESGGQGNIKRGRV